MQEEFDIGSIRNTQIISRRGTKLSWSSMWCGKMAFDSYIWVMEEASCGCGHPSDLRHQWTCLTIWEIRHTTNYNHGLELLIAVSSFTKKTTANSSFFELFSLALGPPFSSWTASLTLLTITLSSFLAPVVSKCHFVNHDSGRQGMGSIQTEASVGGDRYQMGLQRDLTWPPPFCGRALLLHLRFASREALQNCCNRQLLPDLSAGYPLPAIGSHH